MQFLDFFCCVDDAVKEPALPEPDTAGSPGETINASMGATTGEQIPDIVREPERLTGKRAGSASKGMDRWPGNQRITIDSCQLKK